MYKNIKFFAFIFTLGLATCFLISCNNDDGGGGDPQLSEEERAVLEDLVGTWNVTDVTQNGEEPQVGDYSNLVLTIDADLTDGSNKVYSVTGGGHALPTVSNASWSFVQGSLTTNNPVIEPENGNLLRINSLDATTLVLQTEVTDEPEDGRTVAIGTYVFTFTN